MATAPRGFADLTAAELTALGATAVRERGASVGFEGTLETGYRACLESRTASRILLQLAQFHADDADALLREVRAIDWRVHLPPGATLACEFTGRHPAIDNTHFGALRLKDGICDQLRESRGARPDVATHRPDVPVLAHAQGTFITLYLDMAGEGLHRRGYRVQAGEAPLRENVAAGVLLRARWPQLCAEGGAFLDPLCGSGTLVIEAALIAGDIAPGLRRDYWGFKGWGGHEAATWAALLDAARARVKATSATPRLFGSDADAAVLRAAQANALRAGIAADVRFERRDVGDITPPAATGLVATNPPYGERLGDASSAQAVHEALGRALREHFSGWQAAVLTAAPEGARALGLRTTRTHQVWNGAIECRLLRIDLARAGREAPRGDGLRAADPVLAQSPGAQMFANRLRKNEKQLRKEAQREDVSCYRLYDADMPEYAFAIDRYQLADGGEVHLYVQEYAAPSSIEPAAAAKRRAEALAALPEAGGVPPERIHLRTRKRQSGTNQYERVAERRHFHTVVESGLRFRVNFSDYLDTGLFLDHRLTRRRVRAAASGARFLNLFCYTASATVYAAAGGAARTVSVDLSNTYLDWAAENFRLNGLDESRHTLVRADCREWLRGARAERERFDLVFLDPPTFSNSKRMSGVLDIQRDHSDLIADCLALLAPGGLLVFSTNARQFALDASIAASHAVEDVSAATLPFDFRRNPRIHRCFEIRAR